MRQYFYIASPEPFVHLDYQKNGVPSVTLSKFKPIELQVRLKSFNDEFILTNVPAPIKYSLYTYPLPS